MGDRKAPTPPPIGTVKPPPPPAPPEKRMDLRSGKPSWDELDAMYARAVGIIADLRARLDAALPPGDAPQTGEASPPEEVTEQALRLRDEVVTRVLCVPFQGADVKPAGPYLLLDDVMRAVERPASLSPVAPQVCQWRETEDGQWETACERMWEFTNGGPEDNDVRYCHGCGKPVEPVALVPAEGEK